MKKVALVILVGIMVGFAANLSLADVIYEQYWGPVSGNNPFCYNSQFVAQDFTVNANSQLTSLTFNAYTADSELYGDPATIPLTDIYVRIYSNNVDSPGTLLYDQHITGTFNGVVTGSIDGYTLRDYTVALPSEALTTGTYWLALMVDPAQWHMHWSIPTFDTIGLSSKILNADGSWAGYALEHSFCLESNAVPIPGAVWLLGTGLVGLAGLGRRKFRKS